MSTPLAPEITPTPPMAPGAAPAAIGGTSGPVRPQGKLMGATSPASSKHNADNFLPKAAFHGKR